MENKHTFRGIGFCGALTIALLVLKVLGKITLSWIWVLAPIWIPLGIYVLAWGILIWWLKR